MDTPEAHELRKVLREAQDRLKGVTRKGIDAMIFMSEGFTCREIADKFGLSVSGVRRNISDMIEKGGFNNKEDPITTAAENKPVVTLRDTK